MVVARQHLPLVLTDPVREIVRVERRHRRHGEDVARGDVDDDDGRRLVADPPRRILVEVGVDGQLDGAAAAIRLGVELLDQLAPGGDLDALTARLTAKRRFKRLLKALLADLHAGNEQ